MAQKTLIAFFFLLLPWQTRWIIAPGGNEYETVAVTVIEVIFWLFVVYTVIARESDDRSNPTCLPARQVRMRLLRFTRNDGLLVFLFLVWSALSLLWTSDRLTGIVAFIHLLEGVLLCILLRSDDKLRQLSVRAFIIGMIPAALLGIYQFLTQHITGSTILGIASHDAWMAGASVVETTTSRVLRAYGPFPHPNIFGGYLVAALLLIIFRLEKGGQKTNGREKTDPPLVLLAAVPVFSAALVATFSRSAWLGLAIGLLYLTISNVAAAFRLPSSARWKPKGFRYIVMLAAILAPFILTLILAPSLFRARVTGTGRLEVRSTVERTMSLRAGFDAFRSHPIFGGGLGSLRTSEPPHNFFLALATDLGLIGLLLFLITSLRGVRRRSNPILIALVVLALFDHYLWTLLPGVWLLWFALTLTERTDHSTL